MKTRNLILFGCLLVAPLLSHPSLAQTEAPKLVSPADTWPRDYQGENGEKLTLYTPQFDQWDYLSIQARVAGAVGLPGQKLPQFGTFQFKGSTEVDPATRQVKISNIQLVGINFPTLDPKQIPELTKTVQSILPKKDVVTSVDRILGSLQRNQQQQKLVQLKNSPPPIFFSQKPAVLMILDGAPVWSPIVGTDLKYAVNTNWDFFQDAASNLYLRNGDYWLKEANGTGPWAPAGNLPASFSNLPKDSDNWKEVISNIPGKQVAADQVPTVYVSQVPAEMIVTQGPPVLEAIPGTQLSYVKNTTSDLFFYNADKNYYFLTSGRWFKSTAGVGAIWTYAGDNLPADFKNIPSDSPKASVLASVAGTREAEEALIQAEIPVRAKVKKSEAKADATYAGPPKFEKIEGTDLQYATNTKNQVISYQGKYYMVKDAVWFVASAAEGPWVVADSVPEVIYTIPPSSPLYNVTYVKIYESTPEYVSTGYTAGYFGAFAIGTALGATLAYGTGWYYPPYVAGSWFYPYPYTYGMAAYYNPWTGYYGRYGAYYGPYYGAGYNAWYNPATGTYARGGAVYGPYGGYRAGGQAYNPWTNTYAATRQGSNGYSNWGSSVVQHNDDWARTGHYGNGENGIAGYNTSAGNHGFVAKDNGDVYAGRDGNVYRHTDNGWQKYDNGSWNNVNRDNNSMGATQNSRKEEAQSRSENKGSFQNSEHNQGLGENRSGSEENRLGSGESSRLSSNSELGSQLNQDWGNRMRGNDRVEGYQNFERNGGFDRGGFDRSNFNSGGFDRGGFGGGGFRGGGFGGRRR